MSGANRNLAPSPKTQECQGDLDAIKPAGQDSSSTGSRLKGLFRKSPWRDFYQRWRPNLIADAIHQIIIDQQVRGKVLDIGGGTNEWSPLHFPYFRENAGDVELTGVNLDETQTGTFGNFRVVLANAHDIPFGSAVFDCVISNAMLEHDPEFWLTLREIRRVLKVGGLFIAGAPGYSEVPLGRWFRFLPGFGAYQYDLSQGTLTYMVHSAPGDYYRFSKQAFSDVIFSGFKEVQVRAVMCPPRIVGHGYKAG